MPVRAGLSGRGQPADAGSAHQHAGGKARSPDFLPTPVEFRVHAQLSVGRERRGGVDVEPFADPNAVDVIAEFGALDAPQNFFGVWLAD